MMEPSRRLVYLGPALVRGLDLLQRGRIHWILASCPLPYERYQIGCPRNKPSPYSQEPEYSFSALCIAKQESHGPHDAMRVDSRAQYDRKWYLTAMQEATEARKACLCTVVAPKTFIRAAVYHSITT